MRMNTFQPTLNFWTKNVVELCVARNKKNVDPEGRVQVGQPLDRVIRQYNSSHCSCLPPVNQIQITIKS